MKHSGSRSKNSGIAWGSSVNSRAKPDGASAKQELRYNSYKNGDDSNRYR